MVIESKKGKPGGRELDLLRHKARIEIVPLNDEQFELGRQAWGDFGKGHHPAGLDVGDYCSYALSKDSGEPLFFKGDDFSKTDVQSALPQAQQ